VTDKDKSEVRTASATGGEKGVKLARYELIPTGPLQELASRFGLGAMKYDHRNWERGYEWSKSFGALMRHAQAFWAGEADDDLGEEAFAEAGLEPVRDADGRIPGSSHLAAVAFHALALLEWTATHPEFDDRVKPPAKPEPAKTEYRFEDHRIRYDEIIADMLRPRSRVGLYQFMTGPWPPLKYDAPMTHYTMRADGSMVDNRTGQTIVPGVSAEEDEESSMRDSLQKGLDRDQHNR
jgi:hypothetical protein